MGVQSFSFTFVLQVVHHYLPHDVLEDYLIPLCEAWNDVLKMSSAIHWPTSSTHSRPALSWHISPLWRSHLPPWDDFRFGDFLTLHTALHGLQLPLCRISGHSRRFALLPKLTPAQLRSLDSSSPRAIGREKCKCFRILHWQNAVRVQAGRPIHVDNLWIFLEDIRWSLLRLNWCAYSSKDNIM